VHHHENTAPIIQLEYQLARGEELQPGHHSIPFTLPVPSWLPSTFGYREEKDSKNIHVKYTLYTHFKKTVDHKRKTHSISLC